MTADTIRRIRERSRKQEYHMTLDELSDSDPDAYIKLQNRIIKLTEEWCKNHFLQSWASISEIGEFPNIYPNNTYGYIVVVDMPDYPARKRIEVLVSANGSMSFREALSDIL